MRRSPNYRSSAQLSVLIAAFVALVVLGCRSAVPPRISPAAPPLSPTATNAAPVDERGDDLTTLEAAARSGEAKALARYGSALAQRGRTTEGIDFLRRAVARDPKLTAAWHNLALTAEGEGWLDVAADAYAKVVVAKPNHAGEWVKYGYTLIALGRYDAAEKAFRRAVALQPQSSESLVALASLYYADFHFDKALDALAQATKINPHSAAAFVNTAAIQAERHKDAEAETAIRKAIALEPDAPRYHLILGGILSRSSVAAKRAEAAQELRKAASPTASPAQQAEALYFLGVLARENHDPAEAIAHWRQALTLDPSRPDTRMALGHLLIPRGGTDAVEGRTLLKEYERLQKQRDEEQKLRQRVEEHPDDGAARLRYGTALREQGALPRAIWELREAVRLRPNDASARAALVRTLRQQSRDTDAAAIDGDKR